MRNFQTKDASKRLEELGVSVSPRQLEKCRNRGEDDPRDRGPDFYRDERGRCWYSDVALNQYVTRVLAARQFRAPASRPENFVAPRVKARSVA
jgi:hypothetical protein